MEPYHEFKSFDTEEIPEELADGILKVIKLIEKNGGFIIAASVINDDLVSNVMVKGLNPEIVKQAVIQIGNQFDRYIPKEGETKH
jgi:hypothetical protein